MVGKLAEDITIIMDKLEEVSAEIEPHGKVAEFLENVEVNKVYWKISENCIKITFVT